MSGPADGKRTPIEKVQSAASAARRGFSELSGVEDEGAKKLPSIPAGTSHKRTGIDKVQGAVSAARRGFSALSGVEDEGAAPKLPGVPAAAGKGVARVQGAASAAKRAFGALSGAPDESPGAPAPKTSLAAGLRNAGAGGGKTAPGTQQSARGAGLEIAAKIAKGAASGGAVGAARAGAVALLKNKKTRKIILIAVAVLLIGQLAAAGMAASLVTAATSATDAQMDAATDQAASDADIDDEVVVSTKSLGRAHNIPWPILASMQKHTKTEPDMEKLTAALDAIDPSGETRDIDAGVTFEASEGVQMVREDNAEAVEAAVLVRTTYVDAIATLDGFDEKSAGKAYDQALEWSLGQTQSCPASASATASGDIASLTVKSAPMNGDQEVIAKTIIGITKSYIIGDSVKQVRAAEIAVATSIVETTLLNHTEKVDHDSLGIFQQRDSWGTDAQRIRPDWATARFYETMVTVFMWDVESQGSVAQKVQVSAYPDRYNEQLPEAKAIVATLWNVSPAVAVPADSTGFWSGGILSGASTATAGDAKSASASTESTSCVQATGLWVVPYTIIPTPPVIYDWYGNRIYAPEKTDHSGIDFSMDGGLPIYAVSSGTVLVVGTNASYGCGYYIQIQHEGAVMRYCHFESISPLSKGDTVVAGQEIGKSGTTGKSSGTHLHFDISVDGKTTDPVFFMKERGVDFSTLLKAVDVIGPYHG